VVTDRRRSKIIHVATVTAATTNSDLCLCEIGEVELDDACWLFAVESIIGGESVRFEVCQYFSASRIKRLAYRRNAEVVSI